MSIIENALKKASQQGLVDNAGQEPEELSREGNIDPPSMGNQREDVRDEGIDSDTSVAINWEYLTAQGFITPNDTKSQLAEEFRVIKRPLVNNIQAADINGISRSNLILICSSLPGEGKTFVSVNLALSIANELDKNVLLIDADVEKPGISKHFGIKRSPGLIEYLENDTLMFSDILVKTDLPNLSIIPAGKRHNFSTELLSSQRMFLFAEEVSRRYKDRIVIFDSPPLLVATQAQVLAELVGQVVLVIAAEETPQGVVNESVSKLVNCDVVMTLLNKTKRELELYGYGYGYGKYGHS
ncbi:MAG: XrtA-associated tyrosine autokinase [Gammaproteobacteria bacterium]